MTRPALVLTAGHGTRLDPLTRLVAKPAVPLGDRSLVERILAWLRSQRVRDVVLNLHHLPSSVTAIVGDGAHLGMAVRYSWEQTLLGSAGGPRHALPILAADEFLIVNGDTLCDFTLAPMVEAHAKGGADVTLAVVPNPAPDHYNGIVADRRGIVTGFVPKGYADGSWHLVGVQIARSHVFEHLPDGVPAETVSGLYRDLVAARPGRIQVFPVRTTFVDVGTPRDYFEAAQQFAEATAARDDHGHRPSGRRVIVWPGADVDARARLEDAIVIGDARVPAAFEAHSAVIAPARIVRPGESVEVHAGLAVFPF